MMKRKRRRSSNSIGGSGGGGNESKTSNIVVINSEARVESIFDLQQIPGGSRGPWFSPTLSSTPFLRALPQANFHVLVPVLVLVLVCRRCEGCTCYGARVCSGKVTTVTN